MRESFKKNRIGIKFKEVFLSLLLVSVFLLYGLAGVQLFGMSSAEGPYDWPMFRHDVTRSGYSESPAPNTNDTFWTYTVGNILLSSPAVASGRVYFAGYTNNDYFYCLNATTGEQLWNYTMGDGTISSPAVFDGKVYVGSNDNKVYCLDAETGASIWNYTTGDAVAASSPAVVDGKVYVGSYDDNLYCLDALTGAKIWNYTTGDDIYASSPIVVDGKVYVGSVDNNFYCFDALSGTVIWNFTAGSEINGTPAYANGRVYTGCTDDNVYCLDAATGAKIWNYTTGDNANNLGIAYDKVYLSSSDSNVYCLDAATGAKIWNYTTGAEVVSPPGIANDKVYVAVMDGYIYCLDALTGALIWKYHTDATIMTSSPAIANGLVYVTAGNSGEVYAFGAEPPLTTTAWSKTYGGTGDDAGTGETVHTSDGGYAIAGDTNSSGAGGMDFWLIKTDADGNMEWNKTYGGSLDESAMDMCKTSDGGYAISGSTYSFGAGGQDVWLVKTDADGNMEWNQTYGGAGDDYGHPVIQTSDGGYLISCTTNSYGVGGQDAWLVKTDAEGVMLWNQTYGDTGDDVGRGLVQAGDGGYALVVITDSFGAGGQDTWLVKTDADGNMEWNQTYGGAGDDYGFSLIQSSDGGYAMAGYTTSAGGWKIYLIKAGANGNELWNQTYGISVADIGIHGIQTSDGGYAIVGWIYQNGQDFALYKVTAMGDLEWANSYGGTGVDNAFALLQTDDGGYLLTGTTSSFGAGGTDVWLVKVDTFGHIPESFTILVVVLLSTIAVIVSFWILRKKPK